ncbi:hypothetical protein [Bradyrhizobium japonicum]|uniref:hypothetical protein n=1 Tax=Bradyrhizobium japonicum TaxID=375 RepID=UPI0004B695B8|nr:hypothetical protein [Bradyrhizobium japonicum]MCD9819777.1 hypothetical protein [Bradyrhizobium japonicum]MEB2675179.1 hypothetical protein [Bradyrhizobium japonicum]WLB25052.1 hypothetical protein QIH85_24545 [Bradyrhizobium japonicum]WRI85556.1 hypothetical protein R3F75_26610 [Bradyrhizobium japonicum]
MADVFDLFGDPVPPNWGERGRPQHVPTQQNRNRVSLLVALGWSPPRIAAALFVTPPTLRKHYFSELKFAQVARDRLVAQLGMKLLEGVNAGNVSAIREFQKYLERNDLMLYGQTQQPQKAPPADKPVKAPKLGKKEQAELDARSPDAGSTLGELMARRQQGLNS